MNTNSSKNDYTFDTSVTYMRRFKSFEYSTKKKKKTKLSKTTNCVVLLTFLPEMTNRSPTRHCYNIPSEQINEYTNDVFKSPLSIFVKGVNNYLDVCVDLVELLGVHNFVCKAFADGRKILTASPESYKTLIVHFLKDQKAQFSIYLSYF